MSEAMLWVGDALVILGLAVLTLSVLGTIRLPSIYMKLHGASKAAPVGIVLLALASIGTLDIEIIVRALLAATLVMMTAPVSAYAVARVAYRRREPMRDSDAIDESGARIGGRRTR